MRHRHVLWLPELITKTKLLNYVTSALGRYGMYMHTSWKKQVLVHIYIPVCKIEKSWTNKIVIWRESQHIFGFKCSLRTVYIQKNSFEPNFSVYCLTKYTHTHISRFIARVAQHFWFADISQNIRNIWSNVLVREIFLIASLVTTPGQFSEYSIFLHSVYIYIYASTRNIWWTI